MIACPEYAHGIPGSFKNALDWLVGSTGFPGKPVMLVNTSARASHTQAQLHEVLTTIPANVVCDAGVTIDLREADADQILQAGLMAFVKPCGKTPAQP